MTSIASTIQAAAARGSHRPFGSAGPVEIEPDGLRTCNDPLPGKRVQPTKYSARFEAMKMGQALIVAPNHVDKVSAAMRNWIAATKKDAHVRSVQEYPGCRLGHGRVWLMAGPQSAPHAVHARKRKDAANTSMAVSE